MQSSIETAKTILKHQKIIIGVSLRSILFGLNFLLMAQRKPKTEKAHLIESTFFRSLRRKFDDRL